VESLVERGVSVVVRAWEPHRESSYSKMSKSLVRWGEADKGKSASSKTTCQETTMLLVVR
jgi:hypothetical protein